MHNLLHCAAAFACHFRLATVAIRADADRIYLHGNVKVVLVLVVEGSLSTETRISRAGESQIVHLSARMCKQTGEIYTRT